ncbi:MAG: CDP-diacylglycerol--glycerol-3-phosphate 3-phosphatidyltransferase [Candidatus Omnitrophica bacterium]|nr:CDP-diacylglycerol--glycerol-3-phosphate 3-phosphatidyltransferase [Candidatus Omnitrophota bacterium]MBU4488911.1 CDP-diacylglycerol--glycerol-3-phosphate 3-phosphatidyltransferase [Candidatus Omnitrophota bacterium]MCG2705307.1 CDP-diacylglycerol--glycerol-3-phosphate 3-phosphatidyltransferase [Candidatus Omnitrophota bacterium]
MNLPNKLTILRMVLAVVFLVFLFAHGAIYKILAFLTFLIAALSDFFDGYLAKKYNMISDFGRLMDPIADKVLVIAAFLAFVEMDIVPAWMVVIIIFREFVVTGMRLLALQKREVIEATMGGKHKTVSQMVSIFIILLFLIFREFGRPFPEGIILVLMTITVILTIISGTSFFLRNRRIIWPNER